MAAPTRTKAQREADLAEITRLYCSGWRQVDIADRLGIVQQQVSYDLKAIFAEWRKARDADLTRHINEELAKINALELEYWAAWRRSCEDRKRTVKEQRKGAETQTSRAAITEESMLGNPSYLTGVQWCIAKRVEILGLAAPTKIAPTTPDGANPYMGMPDDVLRAELARYALASGLIGGAPLPLDDGGEAEPTPPAR